MKPQDYQIEKDLFVFHEHEAGLHDGKLQTKPVTYFKDAMHRFAKNKGSIVAAIIIGLLILFAIVVPLFSKYTVSYYDTYYKFAAPKWDVMRDLNIHFWDGGTKKEVPEAAYRQYIAIEEETGRSVVIGDVKVTEVEEFKKMKTYYKFRLDTYNSVGVVYLQVTEEQYKAIQDYQDRTGIQVIYPQTDLALRPQAEQDQNNANFWYKTKLGDGNKTVAVYDAKGNFIPIYASYTGTDGYTSKVRFEGEGNYEYDYAQIVDSGYKIRVDYQNYYIYTHTEVLKDGITEPSFLFGTTNYGQDILTCLASGARFSFILAIIVASVNLFVGAIYGAIEGYYGGKADLIMERICDLLGAIPSMIVITLLKYHLDVSHVLILFISFFVTGWIGMAGRTRMQFYRFKNQEYVLVARTLGARDRRIMFKHIFPNAIGTLITGSVLVIPSVIFSETSLSYLGIINLNTGNMTSVGTLLSTGQNYLFTYPHMLLFPSIFISLLMLSFNLFGNGLRDAFNPSLRGTED